jgi:hypothetical protein
LTNNMPQFQWNVYFGSWHYLNWVVLSQGHLLCKNCYLQNYFKSAAVHTSAFTHFSLLNTTALESKVKLHWRLNNKHKSSFLWIIHGFCRLQCAGPLLVVTHELAREDRSVERPRNMVYSTYDCRKTIETGMICLHWH